MERTSPAENLKGPHYGLPVAIDFFCSGTSAGAAVIAATASVANGPGAPAVAAAGYLIAFPLICVSLALLVAELGYPRRFLHMLWSPKSPASIGEWTLNPLGFHLKLLSPMSVGAWGLAAYSAVAFLSLAFTWLLPGWAPWRLELPVAVAGAILGFFVGGYKGVLLRATPQPLWRATIWLGPLMLVSSATSGLAAIALVNVGRRLGYGPEWTGIGTALALTLIAQAVVSVLFLVGLGSEVRMLSHGPLGALFWGVAVSLGLLLPLVLAVAGVPSPIGPVAILAGSLALRYAILTAPSRIQAAATSAG